jgi:hypothetical protein
MGSSSDGYFNDEAAAIFFIRAVGLFLNAENASHGRPFFEGKTQLVQAVGSADGEDFDAAVAAIADVAIDSQFTGDMFDVVAEADALHTPRDNVTPSQKIWIHGAYILAKRLSTFTAGGVYRLDEVPNNKWRGGIGFVVARRGASFA